MLDQVSQRQLDIVDAARMFAGVTMTIADSAISVWRTKYRYGFWRPITAIREADTDGNPATAPDPQWTPLLTTPNYPEYVSGYSGVTGAFTAALARMLGTRHLDLQLVSTAVPGAVRRYDSGRALDRDVIDGRIWLGIHFRTADTQAVAMGQALARWALSRYLLPVQG